MAERILIVEDDCNFARTLIKLCNSRHYKCVHAADGETGIALAREFSPDAVILDIRLPGMKGLEVLDVLKSDKKLRHIPVHVMSVENENIEAYRRGAVGF